MGQPDRPVSPGDLELDVSDQTALAAVDADVDDHRPRLDPGPWVCQGWRPRYSAPARAF